MLAPSIFGENLFDDWFGFPEFRDFDRTDKKLYGHNADRLMKTDVHEHDDHFELAIDLPGFSKDQLNLELQDGYLTVSASKGVENEEKKDGRVIRHERYSGAMQRRFYVGDGVTEEDIKASYKDGVLELNVPKKEKAIPEKKTIMIEG